LHRVGGLLALKSYVVDGTPIVSLVFQPFEFMRDALMVLYFILVLRTAEELREFRGVDI
jgi:hypothetical protein